MSGPRVWSEADDATVALWAAGQMTAVAAAKHVGVTEPSIRFRARRLGLTEGKLPPPKTFDVGAMPKPGDPFVAIAHKSNKHWRPYDGAPVTIGEAQGMVAAGIATMAHKRIDGGWDLLFKRLA